MPDEVLDLEHEGAIVNPSDAAMFINQNKVFGM